MSQRDFEPIHPGEILLEEFLKPMGISEIVQGKRSITADTALRLGHFFRMEAQFWLNLQTRYDLLQAQHALASRLEQEVHPYVGV